jgi:hypothetical protein
MAAERRIAPAAGPWSRRCLDIAPPRQKVPKQPPALNPDPGALIERFHADLVELEDIAITADECVTALPVIPRGKYQRTTKRLYLLVARCRDRRPGQRAAGADRGCARRGRVAQNGKRRAR